MGTLCRLSTMGIEPRLTTQTLKVLGTLMTRNPDGLSGAEIGRSAKLQSGTLYPILLRLEQAGWLKSRWEAATPQELGRPRRRFYQLTGIGARNAKAGFRDVTATIGELAWQRR
jgi:PadR family transcriptional regulator, regulatory protein PadR